MQLSGPQWKALRQTARRSQTDVALHIQRSYTYVSQVETGRIVPPPDIATKMKLYLNECIAQRRSDAAARDTVLFDRFQSTYTDWSSASPSSKPVPITDKALLYRIGQNRPGYERLARRILYGADLLCPQDPHTGLSGHNYSIVWLTGGSHILLTDPIMQPLITEIIRRLRAHDHCITHLARTYDGISNTNYSEFVLSAFKHTIESYDSATARSHYQCCSISSGAPEPWPLDIYQFGDVDTVLAIADTSPLISTSVVSTVSSLPPIATYVKHALTASNSTPIASIYSESIGDMDAFLTDISHSNYGELVSVKPFFNGITRPSGSYGLHAPWRMDVRARFGASSADTFAKLRQRRQEDIATNLRGGTLSVRQICSADVIEKWAHTGRRGPGDTGRPDEPQQRTERLQSVIDMLTGHGDTKQRVKLAMLRGPNAVFDMEWSAVSSGKVIITHRTQRQHADTRIIVRSIDAAAAFVDHFNRFWDAKIPSEHKKQRHVLDWLWKVKGMIPA